MAKIPIEIQKVKFSRITRDEEYEMTEYLISIFEKGKRWHKSIVCNLADLEKFRDEISKVIDLTSTAEKLNIAQDKAKKLDKHYANDALCLNCKYRYSSHCKTCVFELHSPLERKLYLALTNEYIKFSVQYPLNWNGEHISIEGKSYHNPKNNFKEVLTVADFFLDQKGIKLCVYTDGHTFHEKTEEQAQHDKRIDRKLQKLGYKVLRYTGKDVNEDVESIVREIKTWIN